MAPTHPKHSTREHANSPWHYTMPSDVQHAFIVRVNSGGIRLYRAVPALPYKEWNLRVDYGRLSDSQNGFTPEAQWSRFSPRVVTIKDGKPVAKWPTWDRAKTTAFKKDGFDPWGKWQWGNTVPDKTKRHDYDATMRTRYTFVPIVWWRREQEPVLKPLQAGQPGLPNRRPTARKVDLVESCIEEGEDVARDRWIKVESTADKTHQPRAHSEPVLCSAEDKEIAELYKKGILHDEKPDDEITLGNIQHEEPTYSIRIKHNKRRGKSRRMGPRREEQEAIFLDEPFGTMEEITDEEAVMSLYKDVMEQVRAANPDMEDNVDFVVVVGDEGEELDSVTEAWSVIGAEG